MSGPGSVPIDTGWKCISCRSHPPSSTLPNDFGSTRGGRELTTDTSLPLPSYSPHSRVSLVRCNLIQSRSVPIWLLLADYVPLFIRGCISPHFGSCELRHSS